MTTCSQCQGQCSEEQVTSLTPQPTGFHYVDTVEDLRNVGWSAHNKVAFTAGAVSAFDGAGRRWGWSENSTGTDDATATPDFVKPHNILPAVKGRWVKF